MKKKYVKAFTVATVLSLCLCACGEKSGEKSASGEGSVFESVFGKSSASDAQSEGDYDTPVTIVTHSVSCSVDGKERANGAYPEIVLSDSYRTQYPKLAGYIDSLNLGYSEQIPDTISEYANWAEEDTFNEDALYYSAIDIDVVRADDRLFSMLISYGDESGGAHPNHGSSTLNVDPVTGNLLTLSDVLADDTNFAVYVRNELEIAYPGITEEVDSFYFQEEGEDPDVFRQKLDHDSYTWTIDEKGLNIFFSPYEIASYATGDMEITLTTDNYPELIQQAYKLDKAQDMNKIVRELEGDSVTVSPKEEPQEPDVSTISNPTWKKYVAEGQVAASEGHISLEKVTENKTDWLDTAVWAEKNGFELANLCHEDENYYYSPYNYIDYDYMYTALRIYNNDMSQMLYDLNLDLLCNGPDDVEGKFSAQSQFIRYAEIVDGILYASIGHWGYASEEPWSSYMVAIDLDTKELLFRSEPLVSNANNFKIVDNTIICGYGFTAEPDYIYLLDRFTGEKIETITVNSAPSQFEVVDDMLYMATYDTAYEFKIAR